MNKLLPSLAIALALTAGVAAPVLAAPSSLTGGDSSFNGDLVLQGLRDKGVNAVEVTQDWDGRVKAIVQLDNGSVATEYYDEDTLQRVGQGGQASRVLTKLDVQRGAPVVSLDSLTHDDGNVSND